MEREEGKSKLLGGKSPPQTEQSRLLQASHRLCIKVWNWKVEIRTLLAPNWENKDAEPSRKVKDKSNAGTCYLTDLIKWSPIRSTVCTWFKRTQNFITSDYSLKTLKVMQLMKYTFQSPAMSLDVTSRKESANHPIFETKQPLRILGSKKKSQENLETISREWTEHGSGLGV